VAGSRAAHRARAFWDEGHYCAESVLLAVAGELGISSPDLASRCRGFVEEAATLTAGLLTSRERYSP
jgi:hypothetical protein